MSKQKFDDKFKILEDIATADVAFEIYGRTEQELFENAALAVEETMTRTSDIKPLIEKKIELESDELDKLLFNFLSELLYLKDAEALLFSKFSVKVRKNGKFKLTAVVNGNLLSTVKELRTDVKAVTWHMFKLGRMEKGWKAQIIIDV